MTHGSLFSGIGGFDLAAEWMGWENKFHCEWNEFGQRVLKHYWPQAELFTDITKSDFTKYANKIDVLTGGFPCQPYSMAGKRLGKDDDRHLWPQMLRAIREIQPTWVVGENVLGIVNWNGGLVFEEVQADLEAEGYEVQPYVLPACAVNAPHRRDRVWFVAYSNKCSKRSPGKSTSIKRNGSNINDESSQWRESTQFNTGCNEFLRNAANTDITRCKDWTEQHRWQSASCRKGEHCSCRHCIGIAPDTNGNGFNECNGNDEINASERGFDAQRDLEQGLADGIASDSDFNRLQRGVQPECDGEQGWDRQGKSAEKCIYTRWRGMEAKRWENFPTQSPICGGDDGLPSELDGITFSKWRNESIKAYGNAVVPQVVYQLFKTIALMNDNSFTNHD